MLELEDSGTGMSNSNPLRIAVVGVGRMGLTHAENLAHRVRQARLVAVTTSSAERAEAVRRCCGAVPV